MPAYEVDLWGKIRRANEAARARYLATQDAQRTVRQTLVAEVATAYLDLLELTMNSKLPGALTRPAPTRSFTPARKRSPPCRMSPKKHPRSRR
jgi:multidrug efflux system outer membrane protein